MTEIFISVPLMTLSDRLNSPSIVKSLVQKIHPYLHVESVYWTQYILREQSFLNKPNKCIIELSSSRQDNEREYNYSLLRKNTLELEMLRRTLDNMKQDLSCLMRDYQLLNKQNKVLTKQLGQKLPFELSQQNTRKQQKHVSAEILNSITQQKQKVSSNENISFSLDLNSNINTSQNQNQKQTVPIGNQQNEMKGIIQSLEKQICDLMRENIQLKNTAVYYETRLQFIGQCLQKMEEQKEKEKCANQNKKSKK